jgi:hypothetical protein
MCNSDTIIPSAIAQAGLGESLSLYGGRWTIQAQGLDCGDYLLTAAGETPEVVTVSQNYRRETFYACTCNAGDSFYTPTTNPGVCTHIGLVALFLDLRVEVLAGALGRQARWLKALIMKRTTGQGDPAREDKMAARAGELQYWLNQRRGATVRIIPRRITQEQEQTEGASAPSLAGRQPSAPALVSLISELWGSAPVLAGKAA